MQFTFKRHKPGYERHGQVLARCYCRAVTPGKHPDVYLAVQAPTVRLLQAALASLSRPGEFITPAAENHIAASVAVGSPRQPGFYPVLRNGSVSPTMVAAEMASLLRQLIERPDDTCDVLIQELPRDHFAAPRSKHHRAFGGYAARDLPAGHPFAWYNRHGIVRLCQDNPTSEDVAPLRDYEYEQVLRRSASKDGAVPPSDRKVIFECNPLLNAAARINHCNGCHRNGSGGGDTDGMKTFMLINANAALPPRLVVALFTLHQVARGSEVQTNYGGNFFVRKKRECEAAHNRMLASLKAVSEWGS
jgi:hypothetical protein